MSLCFSTVEALRSCSKHPLNSRGLGLGNEEGLGNPCPRGVRLLGMKEGHVREAAEGLGTRRTLEPSYLGVAVALLLTSSVTFSQSFYLSVPQSPHPQEDESVRMSG